MVFKPGKTHKLGKKTKKIAPVMPTAVKKGKNKFMSMAGGKY